MNVIPAPVHVVEKPGVYTWGPMLRVGTCPTSAEAARALLARYLVGDGAATTTLDESGVRLVEVRADALRGEDGYELTIDTTSVVLRAATAAGFLHAAQTLRQLLPSESENLPHPSCGPVQTPCVHIEDAPRFSWRGLHVDVARHFLPLEDLLRLVDTMALFKLNRLHWHLTDDQGWRLEIRAHPRLTSVGARRAESPRRGARTEGDGTPYGGFYTQDDVRKLVAHAAERGITVVPEIEMPGHTQAALAALPHLGHGKAPDVWTRWGISDRIFNVKDPTFAFLDDVLAEVTDLFPGPWVHLGGDEVPTAEWEASSDAQARMVAEALADPSALQGWFMNRVAASLSARGRRAVCWDEALACGVTSDAVLMVWRDAHLARRAAQQGHDVVLCPMSHCYFDHYQGAPDDEPEAIGGHTDLDKVLAFEPYTDDWSAGERARLLGVQGNLWSEYIHDAAHLEYMAWPRAAALAEVAWSPAGPRKAFGARWAAQAARLDRLGVAYRGRA